MAEVGMSNKLLKIKIFKILFSYLNSPRIHININFGHNGDYFSYEMAFFVKLTENII